MGCLSWLVFRTDAPLRVDRDAADADADVEATWQVGTNCNSVRVLMLYASLCIFCAGTLVRPTCFRLFYLDDLKRGTRYSYVRFSTFWEMNFLIALTFSQTLLFISRVLAFFFNTTTSCSILIELFIAFLFEIPLVSGDVSLLRMRLDYAVFPWNTPSFFAQNIFMQCI